MQEEQRHKGSVGSQERVVSGDVMVHQLQQPRDGVLAVDVIQLAEGLDHRDNLPSQLLDSIGWCMIVHVCVRACVQNNEVVTFLDRETFLRLYSREFMLSEGSSSSEHPGSMAAILRQSSFLMEKVGNLCCIPSNSSGIFHPSIFCCVSTSLSRAAIIHRPLRIASTQFLEVCV